MADLIERLKWTLIENKGLDPDILARAIIKEIESTHGIINPDVVTNEMLEGCFNALPAHYDPPDPKKRPWHAYKASKRFAEMVRKAPKIVV